MVLELEKAFSQGKPESFSIDRLRQEIVALGDIAPSDHYQVKQIGKTRDFTPFSSSAPDPQNSVAHLELLRQEHQT
jgi:hypothetical protein